MKNRTSLTLLEMLIMIMVLALAAALCLRAFVYSGKLSKEDRMKAEALSFAQNAAELLKYHKGDAEKAFSEMGCTYNGSSPVMLNEDWEDCGLIEYNGAYKLDGFKYIVLLKQNTGDDPLLGQTLITVMNAENDTVLCRINAAWQEEEP
ncbi:MAG: hypothetical protein IJI56_06225 [Firmicutes bacterium]|nr:hypothetical protein [Bacillota bacterium]